MPGKPVLIFPAATVTQRGDAGGGVLTRAPKPSPQTQGTRLSGKFEEFDLRYEGVQATPEGIDPEQVIVLETIGAIAQFQDVVKNVSGMEWLGDFDVEAVAQDPGFLSDGSGQQSVRSHLFVIAANRTAYRRLLELWRAWVRNPEAPLPRPYGKLAEAFAYLNDVREWGPRDRVLATGVVGWWEQQLATDDPRVRFEIELWCRRDPASQQAALRRLQAAVSAEGGECLKSSVLPSIAYHGVLVDLPWAGVKTLVSALNEGGDVELLRLIDVKYFSPRGQASSAQIAEGISANRQDRVVPERAPVVALLDGLPLTNHVALQGRLVVDDPEEIASEYADGERQHGTAMASLISHGEYDADEPSLATKIYVRPIMQPGSPDLSGLRRETFPPDELAIDLIHRAVKRLFEGDAGEPPQSPDVKVINLSVGDASQPFDRQISPLARLVDWLSEKYRVLFVVSAGNHPSNIAIPVPSDQIGDIAATDLQRHAVGAMAKQRLERRLLSPAESINAITVGALHAQSAQFPTTPGLIDLFAGAELPSPINPVASGFRRSIKPEILVPGGRQHFRETIRSESIGKTEFEVTNAARQPGQLVAACQRGGASNQHVTRTTGTSNAAALTSRRAAFFADLLTELREERGGLAITDQRVAVLLKAMLVHGATWGTWKATFEQWFNQGDVGSERWWRIKRACAQFLGYGAADFDRGTICSDTRVILLGCSDITFGNGHVYRVPLPPVLNARRVGRRLTVTLAWLTRINPRHKRYRVADLWFDLSMGPLRLERQDADHDVVTRGTIQHEVLAGQDAVVINEGDMLDIQVNCREDASGEVITIPYALMATLEVAEPLPVSIYEQVKTQIDALHQAVPVRAQADASDGS